MKSTLLGLAAGIAVLSLFSLLGLTTWEAAFFNGGIGLTAFVTVSLLLRRRTWPKQSRTEKSPQP